MSKKTTRTVLISSRIIEIVKIKFLLLGTGIGILIGGLVIFIVTGTNKSHLMEDTANYHPATFAVANKFICGCPDCEMELVTCYCTNSSGGMYEIYYISEALKEGLSEEQVTIEVYEKFGKIKERFQHLTDG